MTRYWPLATLAIRFLFFKPAARRQAFLLGYYEVRRRADDS